MNGPSGSCKLYYVLSALINELRRADIRKKIEIKVQRMCGSSDLTLR